MLLSPSVIPVMEMEPQLVQLLERQSDVPARQTLILCLKSGADEDQVIIEPVLITLLGAIGGPTEREA